MNKVEQAICRIREKLPNNEGFVTLGIGCVVKNEELAVSLGWKSPNLIVTSAAVLSPEHLALDRIFLAEFLVFEKKGFEVFDLKLASEFCRTVSSRAVSDEEVGQHPNDRVTVISVEPLDKRGFLKRMVKKSSLQTSRPIDCFNFQDFEKELLVGIFCNVIREFGSLAQEFETRTYKFKYNSEKQEYFLEDFGDQCLELDLQSFPDDQQPLGGVIFSKFGTYIGSLGYGTSRLVPCFVPTSHHHVAENQEENEAQEEKRESELFVEGSGSLDNENNQNLSTDENKNEDNVTSLLAQSDEDLQGEDTRDKVVEKEDNEINMNEQTGESNEQKEPCDSLPEGVELHPDQESVESSQIIDNEKGILCEDVSLEDSKDIGKDIPLEEGNEEIVSENSEGNSDLIKEKESSDQLIPIQSYENENQEEVHDILSSQDVSSKLEGNDVKNIGESVSQDSETGKKENQESVDVDKQTLPQEADNKPSVLNDKDGCELEVVVEINQDSKESPEEESIKTNDGLEVGLHTEADVKVSDNKILQPSALPGVKAGSDSLATGTHQSSIDTNTHVETNQPKSVDTVVEPDKEKVNQSKSMMAEDNSILLGENRRENNLLGVTGFENATATLEEQLDKQLFEKTKKITSEEIQNEGEKVENVEDLEQDGMADVTIPLEKYKENNDNLVEISCDMSLKTVEAFETDGSVVMQEETNKLEQSQSPRKAQDEVGESLELSQSPSKAQDEIIESLESPQSPRKMLDEVGESLEPDALLSSTITNNSKVLDDLAVLLDIEYQQGGIACWHDMALLLDIPKEAYDHCLSYSKSSPTENLMMFLSNTKPQFTVTDLKDALRSIARADVVHILDRYIARSVVRDESVIAGVVERDDTDLLGELALKLDRGSLQNWKSLAIHLEVPRRIFKQFGSQQRQTPAILMLKYLPIYDPDLTVQSLKDACQAISKFDVIKFLDSSGVPGDDAIMDILDDTDIIDEVSDMLSDDEIGPSWKDLAKELKIPAEKFSLFESSAKKSPTKLLLQSVEQCEPDLTVEELILALVAMKRHDVINMLYKHFKRSDIRSILEVNNCLPPEPELSKDEKADTDVESTA